MKNIGYQFIIVILSLINIFLNIEIPENDIYNVNVSEGYTNLGVPTNPNTSGFPKNILPIQSQPVQNAMNVPPVLKEETYLSAAFDYAFGDARLVGDAGVMKTDIALTINPIEGNELPPLNQGMVNVTGDNTGYRMLPKGMVFKNDIDIILPYDTTLLPIGFTPNDIKTYYYDERFKRWIEIERDSIDEANQLVISKVNHFTDFINAILKTPEMPETSAFTPTQMNDIKMANPMEGMPIVSPPTANNNGTTNMTYPIWIPNGRQGMQPNLSLNYSGGQASSWLGVGWDISIPTITVDTRWGVPRYDSYTESEMYLYNGAQLTTKDAQGNLEKLQNRTNVPKNRNVSQSELQFFPRVDVAFDSIVRHGTNPTNYWWSVTDRNGVTSYYGKSKENNTIDYSSVLFDDHGNIAHWGITESVDLNGNTVRYYYSKTFNRGVSDPNALMGVNVYIDSINYTGYKTSSSYTHGLHTIVFVRKDGRADVSVNGNYGLKVVDQCQLCKIYVNLYGPTIYEAPENGSEEAIIGYYFRSKNDRDSKYKTILTDIYKIDAKVDKTCFEITNTMHFNGTRTHFDYYKYPDANHIFGSDSIIPCKSDDIGSFFVTAPFDFDNKFKATALGASRGFSWGIGGNTFVGLGTFFGQSTLSVGGNFNYTRSSTEGLLTLIDLNGDALVDKVYRKKVDHEWKVFYRKQLKQIVNGSKFGPEILLDNLSSFMNQTSDDINWGLQASAIVSYSGSWGSNDSYTHVYFSDVNADGLPDLITDEGVLFNSLDPITGNPTFKNIYQEQAENTSNQNPEFIVTSATEPCDGIIFDGEVSDSVNCYLEYKLDTVFVAGYISGIDTLLFDSILSARLDYGYHYYSNFEDYIIANCYKKFKTCEPSLRDPNIDAVRVWVAPKDGDIEVHSIFSLIEDETYSRKQSRFANGVRYSIEICNAVDDNVNYELVPLSPTELLHSRYILKDDYHIQDTSFTIYVPAKSIIFFRLQSNGNRDFDNVNWEQNIEYITNLGKPEENIYNSNSDFIVTGRDCFQAINDLSYTDATVEIDATINTTDLDGHTASLWIIASNHPPIPFININSNMTNYQIPTITYTDFLPEQFVKFVVLVNADKNDPVYSKIIVNPHIKFTPNNSSNTGNNVRGSVEYFPNVEYSKLFSLRPNRIDTIYQALFGPLYRGWGYFGYNNIYKGADIYDLIDVSTLKKDFIFFNDDQTEIEDDINVEPGQDSDEEDYMHATFKVHDMYDPLSTVTRWIEVYPDNKKQLWFGYGMINTFKNNFMSNTRQVKDNANEESAEIPNFDSPKPVPPVSTVSLSVKTMRKKSHSKSKNKSWGVDVAVISYSDAKSTNTNNVLTDYMDLNGDRYPDFVTELGAQYSKPWGGIGEYKEFPSTCTGHTISISTSEGQNFGGNFPTMKKEAEGGKTTTSGSGSPGATFGNGTDENVKAWLDINGDGLPDKMNNSGKVALNLGYEFTPYEFWHTNPIRKGSSYNIGTSMGGGFLQALTKEFCVSQKSINAGCGISESENNSTRLLLDINGDGLADIVRDDGSYQTVLYNNGNGTFSSPDQIPYITSIDYGISYNESFNVGITLGFSFEYVKFGFGLQASPYNQTFSKDKVQFVDFDGDGFIDQVSSDDENKITVKYNLSGQTNLLKKVTNFTGSTIELEYEITDASYNNPQRTYNLKKITTNDPYTPLGGATTMTEFEYRNPYYNRMERISYGYDTVITYQFDTENNNVLYRKIILGFDNKSFMKKGTKKSETICDANNHVYNETLYNVSIIDKNGSFIIDDNCPREAFPILECEINKFYEGNSTPGITTVKCFQYDGKRNVIKYTNYVDYASNVEDDNVVAHISYKHGQNNNLISLVESIEVYDGSETNLLRSRNANYNIKGQITSLTQISENGESTYDMKYDNYGNIIEVIQPVDINNQRMWYQYEYDSYLHSYPVKVVSALGYKSTTTYDYRWGKPNSTTDMNGNELRYIYDWAGRLVAVRSPKEVNPDDHSLVMTYVPTNYGYPCIYNQYNDGISYAFTRHYDNTSGNIITTTTICDAFGRVIQTKKNAEINGVDSAIVSGKIKHDAFGRVVKQYYPITEPLGTTIVHGGYTNPYSHYYNPNFDPLTVTETSYDILDRETRVILPNSAITTINYGFGTDAFGITRFLTSTTDPKNNKINKYTDPRNLQTTIEAGNDIITKFIYSPMGELIQSIDPNDHKTEYTYNMLGQLIKRNQPDAGITSIQYDLAGHTISKSTQNLINNNMFIEYDYNYNQLLAIRYPKYPENNVYYYYGDINANNNRIGRVWAIEDASGRQEFSYGTMGEVIENIRTFVSPIDDYTYTFAMEFEYDTWNRIKSMVYPDGEQVNYTYNSGGSLKSVSSTYAGNQYSYIDEIKYNRFGQKNYVEYGNGAITTYQYDNLNRLHNLNSVSSNGVMQNIYYDYDLVNNIDSVSNLAMPLSNGLGAQYFQKHHYDNLYRLTSSNGNWHIGNGNSGIYSLGLSYSSDGRIKSKNEYAEQLFTNTLGAISYNYEYTYSDNQVHTLKTVEDQNTNDVFDFQYDPNGNLTFQNDPNYGERFLCWDEENRLMGVTDKNYSSFYMYDNAGERTYKLTGINQLMNVNGSWMNIAYLKNETLYTSPYLVATPQGYTKHYYAGSERIASCIGEGGLSIIDNPLTIEHYTDWNVKKQSIFEQMNNVFSNCLNRSYDFTPDGLSVLNSLNTATSTPMKQYFYHPDHLGSTSWITDRNGKAIQYLHYLPFGEEWIDQKNTSWNAPYTFTGKIKDAETGYNYFGARYYDSQLSVWISVDPLSDKYPSMSPYTYCANNPVILVDPDGRLLQIFGNLAQKAVDQINNYTKMGLYLEGNVVKAKNSGDGSLLDNMLTEVISEDSKINIKLNCNTTLNGSYGGTLYIPEDQNSNRKEEVITTQYANPDLLAQMDDNVGDTKSGGYMIHEIAEAYFASKICLLKQKSSPAAIRNYTFFGIRYPKGCVYKKAHKLANDIMPGGYKETQKYRSETQNSIDDYGNTIIKTILIPTSKTYERTYK